jgi:hypothetical protein
VVPDDMKLVFNLTSKISQKEKSDEVKHIVLQNCNKTDPLILPAALKFF